MGGTRAGSVPAKAGARSTSRGAAAVRASSKPSKRQIQEAVARLGGGEAPLTADQDAEAATNASAEDRAWELLLAISGAYAEGAGKRPELRRLGNEARRLLAVAPPLEVGTFRVQRAARQAKEAAAAQEVAAATVLPPPKSRREPPPPPAGGPTPEALKVATSKPSPKDADAPAKRSGKTVEELHVSTSPVMSPPSPASPVSLVAESPTGAGPPLAAKLPPAAPAGKPATPAKPAAPAKPPQGTSTKSQSRAAASTANDSPAAGAAEAGGEAGGFAAFAAKAREALRKAAEEEEAAASEYETDEDEEEEDKGGCTIA